MDKFTFFRRTHEERLIDLGRVNCPLRGADADVEYCAACGWARTIELEAQPPVVRCRAMRPSFLPSGIG